MVHFSVNVKKIANFTNLFDRLDTLVFDAKLSEYFVEILFGCVSVDGLAS